MVEVLFVIAPDQFRDEEYELPREVLESRGASVTTASVAPGPCRGKLGLIAQADAALSDIDPSLFDAVVFVGGAGSSVFFDDPDAHLIAHSVYEADGILGAICIAPSTLAHAGLLRGVRATAFPTQRGDLEAHGAHFTGSAVERSDRIVTANGPEAAHDFGVALAEVLKLA